jgi:hypothetical protein
MAVETLTIRSTGDYEDGRRWGDAGAYEVVRGVVTFALDPKDPANQRITDIQFSERGPDGLVRGESDFCVLRPKDPAQANGGLFFSVANRGNVTLPFGLGPAPDLVSLPAGIIPSTESLLLYGGWTVAWCGWQFDLTRGPRQLAMTVPQAYQDGRPIEGDFRIDLRATGDSKSLRLLDGTAIMAGRTRPVYPPAGLEQPDASLSVRESPDGARTLIPRERWRFAHESGGTVEPDDAHIWCGDGFKAGEIYELVYRTAYCPVAGMGMAAVRDFVSYLRHSPSAGARRRAAGPRPRHGRFADGAVLAAVPPRWVQPGRGRPPGVRRAVHPYRGRAHRRVQPPLRAAERGARRRFRRRAAASLARARRRVA